MKALFFTFILLSVSSCWAFTYQLDEQSLLKPSHLNAYEFKEIFKRHGLNSLSDNHLVQAGLPFDQVFVSYQWKRSLILKAGLKTPAKMEGKVINHQDMHILHFDFEGSPYMLMGLGFSNDEFKKITRPWRKDESVSFFSLLIPSAYAEECELPQVVAPGMYATAAGIERGELLKKIGECGADALQGMNSSVQGTLEFFKKLATNPAQLWSETKKSFIQLKEFVFNIQSEMQTMVNDLKDIDLEQKLELACTLTGSLLASAGQAFLMGPAALGRAMPLLMLKLKNTTALLGQLTSLQKKGINFPDSKKMASEVMSCGL